MAERFGEIISFEQAVRKRKNLPPPKPSFLRYRIDDDSGIGLKEDQLHPVGKALDWTPGNYISAYFEPS